MRSSQSLTNYLNKILQDESLHRQWEKIYNTSSANLGSESDTDFMASKGSSQNQLSRFLKNARFSFDLQESVEIGGHKHTPDQSFYREKIQEMIQINYCYRQKTAEINDVLTQAINLIHERFSKCINGFQFFSSFVEDNPLEQCLNMAVFIRKTFAIFSEQGIPGLVQARQKIHKLRAQNNIVSKNNENLVGYIEQRKKYSESLKIKISKLREEVKEVAKREQLYRNILSGLDNFQEDLDLKYRNRTDLISMIKCLLGRILKHSKQCMGSQDPDPLLNFEFLDKFTVGSSIKGKESQKDKSAERR